MELALFIALIIGILLFILGFFIVVWAGFKNHFVTGVIALIPALNFMILPSVWHRAYIGFYLSIIGALITLGAWYGGGEQYIANQAQKFGVTLPFSTAAVVQGNISADSVQTSTEQNSQESRQKLQQNAEPVKTETINREEPKQIAFIPSGDLVPLPQQALYELIFETISLDDIASLKGEHVRIEQKDGNITEGKVTQAGNSSLFIEHNANSATIAFEIKADSIRKLEKLVKRNN